MELIRYMPPSDLLDKAPYGFVVTVVGEDDKKAFWIQMNRDPETKCKWVPIGSMLETIFEKDFESKEKVASFLDMHEKVLVKNKE